MPVKISPIKILTDLGYEMVDIETDEDYLSALREGINTIEAATKGSGDKRSEALREELIRVRKERKAAAPSAGMKVTQKKISPSKFFDKKEKKSDVGGKGGAIVKIGNSVTSIVETLKEDQKQDKKQQGWFRKTLERFKRRKKENKLEFKIFDGIKKTATKLLAPMKNAWNSFLGFIGKVILGRILFKILTWMGNKDNQSKLQSIIKFFEDWWPTMLAAYLLFGNAFGRMAVKMGVMVARFGVRLITKIIPQLVSGLAKMKIGKLLKNIPGGGKLAPLIQGTMMVGGGMLVDNMMTGGDAQDFSGEFEGIQQEFNQGGLVQNFNQGNLVQHFKQGGFVSGPRGVDKVPARLTAGEFVMSKGAVQKYGANTLASMNSAGGGTNRPTVMNQYNQGGSVSNYNQGGFVGEQNSITNLTQRFQGGGLVTVPQGTINSYQDLINAGVEVEDIVTGSGRFGGVKWIEKIPKKGLFGREKLQKRSKNWNVSGVGGGADKELAMSTEDYVNMKMGWSGASSAKVESKAPPKLDRITGDPGERTAPKLDRGGNIAPRKTATVITPSEKKKVTVVYEEEKQKMANASDAEQSSQEIPQFDVTLGRSLKKISLLGISL